MDKGILFLLLLILFSSCHYTGNCINTARITAKFHEQLPFVEIHTVQRRLLNQPLDPIEYAALYDLYNSTNGPSWNWNNPLNSSAWDFNDPTSNPCKDHWTGIQCSCPIKSTYCHVTGLLLNDHNMKGVLPESLSKLPELTAFDVSKNSLLHHIPQAFGQLKQLQKLYLTNNFFTGPIPSNIGQCTKLTNLAADRNFLDHKIPLLILQLPLLQQLQLSSNNLTGSIPLNIGDMPSIESLYLDFNDFTGTIPSTLHLLNRTLRSINLGYNKLNGTIPWNIGWLQKLSMLELSGNKLHGTLPQSIYTIQNLTILTVGDNLLTGTLSSNMSLLTNLTVLVMSYNRLHGTLPVVFTSFAHLRILSVASNNLTGTIPASIGNLTTLLALGLYNNSFTQSIPPSIGKLVDVQLLYLQENLLTSSLPNTLHWRAVISFDCSFNSLTGSIPPTFFLNSELLHWLYIHDNAFSGNLTGFDSAKRMKVAYFDIGFNQFTGPLPIGNHEYLRIVNNTVENDYAWTHLYNYLVNTNYFTGTVSSTFMNSTGMKEFNLTNNYVTGTIPSYLTQMSKLIRLLLGMNMFIGTLPAFPVIQTEFDQFYANDNFLTGTIPDSLSKCTGLLELELHNNQLTGTIPLTLFNDLHLLQILFLQLNALTGTIPAVQFTASSTYSLKNVDVSNNQLAGRIPDSLFQLRSLKSFAAVSNCLSGSISSGICAAGNLTGLALDGISTGSTCRQPIFKTISNDQNQFLNAYYLKFHLTGGIPSCLFSMPYLTSLHLSGNGLTGSLPSNLKISTSLVDLSLSYNQLTGSIPEVIQVHTWKTLDLSYNKLTGKLLSDGFKNITKNTVNALYLEVNRLSGEIPPELVSVQNISILRGNMFSCLLDRSDLPSHDSDYGTYSCGSDVTNTSLLVWLGCAMIPVLIFVQIIIQRHYINSNNLANADKGKVTGQDNDGSSRVTVQFAAKDDNEMNIQRNDNDKEKSNSSLILAVQKYFKTSFADVRKWRRTMMYIDENQRKLSTRYGRTNPIYFFAYFAQTIRKIFLFLTVTLIVIYIPLYTLLSQFERTYTNEYVWTVSALLFTGVIAGSVLCFAFAGYLIFTWRLFEGYLLISYRKWKETRQLESEIYNSWKRFGVVCLFLINFVMMILIDVIYVVIYINGDNTAIFFAQVSIAIFKLFWNEVLLWKFMKSVHLWAEKIETKRKNGERLSSLVAFALMEPFRSSIAILNITADTANTSNESTTEITKSEMKMVINSSSTTLAVDPVIYVPSTKDTIFFVILNAVNNIIVPFLAIAAVSPNCFHNMFIAAPSVQSTYSYSSCTVYIGLIIDNECTHPTVEVQDISYYPPFIYGYQCSSYLAINYIPVHIISFVIIGILLPILKVSLKYIYDKLGGSQKAERYSLLDYFLPNSLKELTPHPLPNQPAIFQKHRMVVQINSAFMILLTFGLLFPPLAIIICISIITITLFDELMIGKLLYQAKQLGYTWYQAKIEGECDNVANGFHITIWITLVLSSMMCGYLVFDTFGDALGWKIGIGPGIGLSCLPLLIYVWSVIMERIEAAYEFEGREQSFFEMLPPTMFRFLTRESMANRLTKVERDSVSIAAINAEYNRQIGLNKTTSITTIHNPIVTIKEENDLL